MNEDIENFFKALSHRSRLRLLELLAAQVEMSVGELTDEMPREGSTISRHLNQLNLLGIVDVRQDGQNRYYSLNKSGIRDRLKEFSMGIQL